MKTKHIAIALALLLAVCIGLSVYFLMPRTPGAKAVIYSDGKILETVDLSKDRTFVVENAKGGKNTVTIQDGKIAVTFATCPDQICRLMGFCDSGLPIACLPNDLIISFETDTTLDGYAG